jgi:hypothetical protein
MEPFSGPPAAAVRLSAQAASDRSRPSPTTARRVSFQRFISITGAFTPVKPNLIQQRWAFRL